MFRPQLPPLIPFILLILIVIFSIPAGAATFTVTTLGDSGPGSLRQAILDANATLGPDTIAVQSGLTGTITLTTWELEITDGLIINGPGAGMLAISGNNTWRIFRITGFIEVTISGLTLTNGNGSNGGGAIRNEGTLTINNSILSKNTDISFLCGSGGGILNVGTMTVNNSILSGNSTGGIFIDSCRGGGISNYGTLTITNSTLSENTSAGSGGGIDNISGILTVINSTLSNNFANYDGGGICNYSLPDYPGTITINNSTLSGNVAGANNHSSEKLAIIGYNREIYNPSATPPPITGFGGGIYNDGILSIGNSLVAGNTANNGPSIYGGDFISQGHNLFGENGNSGLWGVTASATDLTPDGAISTVINPLADNGGPTQTHALVAGSPAIDAGDNTLITEGFTTDQRGAGFPRIVNDTVDIGAVEAGASIVDPATTLITHYYVSILRREPEPDGLAYWQNLIVERQAQGIDVKLVFRDIAHFFFNSPEYLGRNTSDEEFVTNLYLTFFQREPDEGGMNFWLNQLLVVGWSRNQVMDWFLQSPEFTTFMLNLGF